MAQIPTGNFGNAIAQPKPRVQIQPGAFDNGASGLAKVADSLGGIADGLLAEQRKQEEEAKRVALEAKREAEALQRATAANDSLDYELNVKTVGAEIEGRLTDGSLSHAEAATEYKSRIGEIKKPDATGYDPVTAGNLSRSVKRAEFSGQSAIVQAVGRAQKVDLKNQTDGILDKLGKQASLPGSNPADLARQIDGLDEIGLRSYGAAWGKRKQDWIDNNWDAHLNQQALTVRDSMGGIKALEQRITNGDAADKLDSNRRNTLVAKLEGYRTSLLQRQEVAASRAERQNERRMRQAEAEFNTFQALADKGTLIDPAYVDQVARITSGTPYQKGVIAISQQARETGGIAAQPVKVQRAMLDAIDAQIAVHGRSEALDKRREQVSRVLDGTKADLKDDGLRAGLQRGVITGLAPIDISTPEKFAKSIGQRIEQARDVEMWAGKPVSPLDANEAESLRGMLDALPPKLRSQAVATIAGSVGPRHAGAIAAQLDDKDKALSLAFASSGAKTTAGRYTSELILKGATAIKDGVVMKDDKKVTGWRATIANEVDGAFPNELASGAVKDAAYYITAGIAQENGGSVSSNDIKRAVKFAVGGDIIEHNGKRLPIPAGIDDFEQSIKNVPLSDLQSQAPDGKVMAGGRAIPLADFAKSIPGQELLFAGPGRYAVIVRGRPVTNSQGRPVYIKVKP